MSKFMISIFIIIFGLAVGYTIQQLNKGQFITFKKGQDHFQLSLVRASLLVLNPIALVGALWLVNLSDLKLIMMPFLGMMALLLGGFWAFVLGKVQKLPPDQMGVYIVGGCSTNIGTIGGMIAFIFLGEAGFALVPLYKIFEELIYYGLAFPIAKAYSGDKSTSSHPFSKLRKVLKDPFIIMALLAIVLGIGLNLSPLERPSIYGPINTLIIPIVTILLLISVGLNLEFRQMKPYIRASFFIVIIKIILVPVLVSATAYAFGLKTIDKGLPFKVILILSSMPTGFIAMIPATLYKLDKDLANTIWFLTNISLIITIPWIGFMLNLI